MEEKRKRIIIPYETKKLIYKAYKHDKIPIDEIVEKFGINKKTVYMISHKLSNDPDLNIIKTDSSNKENDEKNESIISDKQETIKEIISKELLTNENVEEQLSCKESEENIKTITHDNNDLIKFLNKDKEIPEEEINEDEETEEPIKINNNLKLKRTNSNYEEPILNKISQKETILNSEDIDVVTINKIDISDNEKNNYIIKIRKYWLYFESDLKNIIDKKKINSLFKLNINELKNIYELLKLEINSKSSLNFENICNIGLTNLEKISRLCNINLDGIKDDLMNDDIFIKNLKILEIENSNLLDILTPKKLIFLMFVKVCYMRYNINNVNTDIDNKLNNVKIDKNIIDKFKKL